MPPAGLIYSENRELMRDGRPIQLFGVNDTMAFVYALEDATLGRNYNFPTFDDRIPNVATPDDFWREYFRHFLHYQTVAGSPANPKPNLLRIAVSWDFGNEESHRAWMADAPNRYLEVFDRMIHWAGRAGVYLCPSFFHGPANRPHIPDYYVRGSLRYNHMVAFERDIMVRYEDSPVIAMWDLYNEADVGQTKWWLDHGGFAAYRTWAQGLIDDVRSASTKHLFTFGHAMSSFNYNFTERDTQGNIVRDGRDGIHEFTPEWYRAYGDMRGLDVVQGHHYGNRDGPAEVYLFQNYHKVWSDALGKPNFAGEVGFGPTTIPAPYHLGHWPWFLENWFEHGLGPACDMTWLATGRGPYADYPYVGALPDYPDEAPAPPPVVEAPPRVYHELGTFRVRSAYLGTSTKILNDRGRSVSIYKLLLPFVGKTVTILVEEK